MTINCLGVKAKGENIKRLLILAMLVLLVFTSTFAQKVDTTRKRIVFKFLPDYSNFAFQDGDSITVENAPNDSSVIYGDAKCTYDSITVIYLKGDTTLNLLTQNFQFRYYNAARNCYSKIDSMIYGANSDSSVIYVTGFIVHDYYAYYAEQTLCINSGPLPLTTDLPPDHITIWHFSNDGLNIDSVGTIYPGLSNPGFYSLTIMSDFCIQNWSDSIKITIQGPLDMATRFPDTLVTCLNGSNSMLDLSEYYLVKPDIEINKEASGFTQSGYYRLSTDSVNVCNTFDSVYVKVVPPQPISFTQTETCDNVEVSINAPAETYSSVNWSDGDTTPTVEVTDSRVVRAELSDKYGCLSADSVFVTFKALEIANVSFQKEESDCWKEGVVKFSDVIVNNAQGSYNFDLVNTINGNIITNFDVVPEGIYKIQVTDSRNCVKDYPSEITIKQKCLEDYPVFSPNQDGIEDEYFIPYEGSVKIYDRNGELIKDIKTPAYWDGNDDNGNPMPMGTYVIITDKGKPVNITIVK